LNAKSINAKAQGRWRRKGFYDFFRQAKVSNIPLSLHFHKLFPRKPLRRQRPCAFALNKFLSTARANLKTQSLAFSAAISHYFRLSLGTDLRL